MNEMEFLINADKYKDTIYRIALNYLKNTHDADDIVQDVLMKLYTNNGEFESEEHIRNWLIRVSINLCKNVLRAPWRRKNVNLNELSNYITFEQREQSELFMLVMGLPTKNRVVLYLFYYEGFSVKEIAKMLNLKESAVTSRLSRARNQLKLELEV